MKELWAIIDGFEDYQVSNLGRVRRWTNAKRGACVGKILKPGLTKGGHPLVALSRDGVAHSKNVLRLVAIAFIPNPLNLPEVNHKDGIKTHNIFTNLEWRTGAGNMQHAVRNGLTSGDGVHFRKDRNKWVVRYAKKHSLGCFDTKEEALVVRNKFVAEMEFVL